MIFDKVRGCFELCLGCLEADAVPDNFLRQKLLHRRDQLEMFLLEEADQHEGSGLRDWLIQGYLRLFDLFLYGWLGNVFIRDVECKEEVMKELNSLVEKCEPSKIDSEAILELAYALTRCQNFINQAFDKLNNNTVN